MLIMHMTGSKVCQDFIYSLDACLSLGSITCGQMMATPVIATLLMTTLLPKFTDDLLRGCSAFLAMKCGHILDLHVTQQ